MHYLKQAGVLCVFEWQHFFSTKDNFMTSCIYFVMLWHCVLIGSYSLVHSAEVHASPIMPLIFFSVQRAFEYWEMFVWGIATCKCVLGSGCGLVADVSRVAFVRSCSFCFSFRSQIWKTHFPQNFCSEVRPEAVSFHSYRSFRLYPGWFPISMETFVPW